MAIGLHTFVLFPGFYMGRFRLLFVYFCLFHMTQLKKWYQHRWCAWDSNPGWQHWRHRHWAMATPLYLNIYSQTKIFFDSINLLLLRLAIQKGYITSFHLLILFDLFWDAIEWEKLIGFYLDVKIILNCKWLWSKGLTSSITYRPIQFILNNDVYCHFYFHIPSSFEVN